MILAVPKDVSDLLRRLAPVTTRCRTQQSGTPFVAYHHNLWLTIFTCATGFFHVSRWRAVPSTLLFVNTLAADNGVTFEKVQEAGVEPATSPRLNSLPRTSLRIERNLLCRGGLPFPTLA